MKKTTALILVFIAFFAISCKKQDTQEESANSNPYALATIDKALIESYLEESGEIQPRSIIKVKFNLTGKVTKLYCEAGDQVKTGQTLASIQPDINQIQTMNSAEIAYQKALASLDSLSNQYQEALILYHQGLMAKASFDNIRHDYDIAHSEVEQASLELESLRESSGTISGRQLVSARSPATGTIVERYVDVGDYILAASTYQSGTVLFDIADISDMVIEARINEVDIVNVEEGAEVEITIEALSSERFTGTVFRVFPTPEESDNVKRYVVQIEPRDRFPTSVLPGMSARIRIQTVHKENAASLPLSCVVRDTELRKDYVLVSVDPRNNIFEKRIVETGVRNYQRIEILSGIQEGETVAVNPYLVPEDSIRQTGESNTRSSEEQNNQPRPPMGRGMGPRHR
jgi:HlyD family secretion protein